MKINIKEIERATDAVVNGEFEGDVEISTDTRTIKSGDLYLPLKGASFDGENFCEKALEAGAIGCFCTKECSAKFSLRVMNTTVAYMQIANYVRNKYNPIVIAVTGSSGKTTTKELIYSVVSQKFKTHKTLSNHNNEIGFCQTVLSMPLDTKVLIIEMGMRGLGEIDFISKYAQPDFAVITNAGSAHIGRLGSLDNIAKAKCEVTNYLKRCLIANDNERIKKFVNFDGEKVYYSINDAQIIEMSKGHTKFTYKSKEFELNVDGEYNVENSISAIEIGLHLGMSSDEINRGLKSYKPIEKRWEEEKVKDFTIINDSYNANPESMKASVSTFLKLYSNPVVILGNMGELGENEIELHREVGNFLGKKFQGKPAKFLMVGNLASFIGDKLKEFGFDVENFENNIETSRYILDNINAGSTIFLKASRSMKFEEIIEDLKKIKSLK